MTRRRAKLRDLPVSGLDLSLRGAAIAIIPLRWDEDVGRMKAFSLSRIRTLRVGEALHASAPEYEHLLRARKIAKALIAFADDGDALDYVFVEQYGFNQNTNKGSRIMELGGIVKDRWAFDSLSVTGAVPQPVVVQSARKLLLGKLPRNDSKKAVELQLKEWGAPDSWTDDECDAFAVANYGRSTLGLTPLGIPPP